MATDTKQDRESFKLKYDDEKITVIESYNLVTDAVGEALDLSALPTIYSAHPTYTWTFVKSIDVSNSDGKTYYRVAVTYESTTGLNVLGGTIPPKFDFEVGTAQIEIDRDIYGNPITNSSGEPPQSNVAKVLPVVVFNVKYTYGTLDVINWADLVGKVNDTSWSPASGLLSFSSKTVQCIGVRVEEFDQNSNNFPVTFKFLYEPDKHVLEFLDKGYTYYDTNQANRVIKSFENVDKEARRLNGYGGLFGQANVAVTDPALGLPAGATRVALPAIGTATGIYLRWNVNETADFTILGL